MDAELEEYENEMMSEECERNAMWGDPERVEPCVRRMSRPAQGQCPQPTVDDDNCMHDVQYDDNTVSRGADEDDEMASDADDAMADACDGKALCRGQKRRLHTVCEMSHAARDKMIKQLDHGVT